MKKIVLFGFAATVLTLAGCATEPLPPVMVMQTIPVKSLPLTSLDVSGPYVVQVINAPAGTPIRVVGDPHSVNATSVSVGSGGKSVKVSGSLLELIPPGPVFVVLPTQQTKTLTAVGSDQASLSLQRIPYEQVNLTLHDLARADVYATQSLTIHAEDNSSAFYYGNPAQVSTANSAHTAEIQQLPMSTLPQITVPTAPPIEVVSQTPTTGVSGPQSIPPATAATPAKAKSSAAPAPAKTVPPVVTIPNSQATTPASTTKVATNSGVSTSSAASTGSAPGATTAIGTSSGANASFNN